MSYDYYRTDHTSKNTTGLGTSLGLGHALIYKTSFHQHNQKIIDNCRHFSRDSRKLANVFLFFKPILQPALLPTVLHSISTTLPCNSLVLPCKRRS